jgi:hypothetical protein
MYLYVCSVQYVVSLLFASVCYLLIIRLVFFDILYKFVVLLSVCFLCCVFFVFVLFCVLFLLLYTAVSFLFVLQVYRPLTPGGNPIAVNKYVISNIKYFACHCVYMWVSGNESCAYLYESRNTYMHTYIHTYVYTFHRSLRVTRQ